MTGTVLSLSCGPGEIRALLTRDGHPLDILILRHPDLGGGDAATGGFYRARVKRLLPGTGGAFVDFGGEADGYLEDASGLAEGEGLLLQLTRPASPDKPARLGRRIALDSPFLLLRPGGRGLELSRRLDPSDRERLRAVLEPLLGSGFGLTVRTVAARVSAKTLAADLARLRIRAAGLRDVSGPIGVVETEPGWPAAALERLLPAILRETPDRVLVDDRSMQAALTRLLNDRLPEADSPGLMQASTTTREEPPALAVDAAIEAALEPVIALAGGGRLVIESTQIGMTIDIDAGSTSTSESNRTGLAVLARALRLRRIGGPIVVDLAGRGSRGEREAMLRCLSDAAASDPAALEILGWTRLGHLELLRPRVAAPLAELLGDSRSAGPATSGRRIDSAGAQAITIGLAGLRALEAAPPRTLLRLPPAAAEMLTRQARAILQALGARRGEAVQVEPASDLAADAFALRPVERSTADPISLP